VDAREFCFESEWPDTAKRLKSALVRRRIPYSVIDDLVQETALRLYQKKDWLDPERGTWPLAFTVAMNILKDQLRSETRRQALTPLAPAAEPDPEAVALARIELTRVREALDLLPESQRSVLLAEIGGSFSADSRSSAAVKMLRMRARKRLRLLTQEASGILGSIELLTQKLTHRFQSIPFPMGMAAGGPIAAGLLSFGVLIGGPTSPAQAFLPDHRNPSQSTANVTGAALSYESIVAERLKAPRADDLFRATDLSGATGSSKSSGSTGAGSSGGPSTGSNGKGKTKKDGPGNGGLTLPDGLPELPPAGGGDNEPVKVEESEASADPEDGAIVRLRGKGSIAGKEAGVTLEITSHEKGANGDSGKVGPSAKGGAQLDGEVIVELGE
jgi:RNA polymerase sigma factor (sigma-70 family)